MQSKKAVVKMIVGGGNESGAAGDTQLARGVNVQGGAWAVACK